MGFLSKAFKTITKPFKSAVKVVKKIAKKVVDVGKKIVKGIGKAVGKLGPLASIALMMIPGMQAFAAGMWSGMGVTSVVGQRMLTSAMVSFVGSGGNLKAAVAGAAMAGIGTAIGGGVSGLKEGTGFFEGASKALSQTSNITSFAEGLDAAKTSWGNFTDGVEKFFKGAGNGDVSTGVKNSIDAATTAETNNTAFNEELAKNVSNTPPPETSEYGSWKATEDSVMRADFAKEVQDYQRLGLDVGTSAEDFYSQRVERMSSRLLDSGVGVDTINEQLSMAGSLPEQTKVLEDLMQTSGLPKEYVTGPGGMIMKNPIYQVADDYGISPFGEQAKQLLESEYQNFSYDSTNNTVNFDKELSYYEPEARTLFRESGLGMSSYVSPHAEAKKDKIPKLAGAETGLLSKPSFVTEGGYTPVKSQYGAGMGQASGIGTDPLKEAQPLLVARIEQERERRARMAQTGWGIA